ncbi:MAG: CPBP family intramembrane metalloprotease [Ignavibacteriales bacterium]|nr:MAG: CPBP family intramembrane metalloprotease [Ignavibacteriales bacterium]
MDEQNNQDNPQHNNDLHPENPSDKNSVTPLINPIGAAFIGLIGGFFLYQFVGGLITILIFGLNVEDAPVNSLRLITMAGQFLFILLPALLFSKIFYQNISAIIRLKIPNWKEILLFVIGIIILTPLLQSYLYIQNYFIDELAKTSGFVNSIKETLDYMNDFLEQAYGDLISVSNVYEGILVVLVISVTPAICEEFMFRGFVQRSFEFKLSPFKAALITAVFFGLYHFNPYGIIPLIGIGLYLGFAAYMSSSIIIPVLLHFLNNFIAVMLYFIFGDDDLISSAPTTNIDISSSVAVFLTLLALFAGLIVMIKKYYSDNLKVKLQN